MSDHDPFNSNPSPSSEQTAADLLAAIKNDKGEQKYRSELEALKGLANSQAHIQTLEQEARQREEELAQLREKAIKAQSLEEVIERLTANKEQKPSGQETTATGSLSEEAVANLVR